MGTRPVIAMGVALFLLISSSVVGAQGTGLSFTYYAESCPEVYWVVDRVVYETVSQDKGIVGGLLRLCFHDCFIRGCDASVLIDSVPPQMAEKDGIGNANSLRGFSVIDQVKSELEEACPGVVSCADIIALVARSAVYQIGGPSWSLPLGRRDGNTSNAGETIFNLPPPFAEYPQLINMFAAKGLDEHDMVVLSGAHAIGLTHCGLIESRLYNSSGPGGMDPALDPNYGSQLKSECPFSNGQSTTLISMDPNSNDTFTNNYFKTVRANQGIFTSDAALLTHSSGASIVTEESWGNNYPFFSDFAAAMTKMAAVQVTLAPEGNVRRNCRVFNSADLSPAPAPSPVPTPAPAPTSIVPTQAPVPSPMTTPTPALAPSLVSTPAPVPSPVSTPTPAPGPVPTPARSPTPTPVPSTPTPAPALAPTTVTTPTPASAPAPTTVKTPTLAPALAPTSRAPSPAPTTVKSPTPAPTLAPTTATLAPVPAPTTVKTPTPTPALAPAPAPAA